MLEDPKSAGISRRSFIKRTLVIAAGLGGANLLAACASTATPAVPPAPAAAATKAPAAPAASAPTTAPAPAAAAAKGKVTVAAQVKDYYVLNPLITDQSIEWTMNNVIEPLVTFDRKTLAILPGLAESWEVSKDGKEYTFHLRKGVKWHDGKPFTSADVKFTVETALLPETAFKYQENWKHIKEVQTPDESTAKFILDAPFAPLLATFSSTGMVPKHILEPDQKKLKETAYSRMPIGTGPYKVTEHTEELITLTANADYWGEKARILNIFFRDVAAGAATATLLKTGGVDLARYDPATMADLANNKDFTIYQPPYVTIVLRIHLNNNDPLFQDKRVRQAMYYALDRQAMITSYGQPAIMADSMVPPGVWAYDSAIKKYPYDPQKAADLMKQAGWTKNASGILEKDGKPFKFVISLHPFSGGKETGLVAQQNWKAIGMDVEIQTVAEWATWVDKVWQGKSYQVSPMAWDQGVDPGAVLPTQFICKSTSNVDDYCTPEMNAMLEQANNITDQAERQKVFAKIQETLAEELPTLPIMLRLWQYIARSNIKGIVVPPLASINFDWNKRTVEG